MNAWSTPRNFSRGAKEQGSEQRPLLEASPPGSPPARRDEAGGTTYEPMVPELPFSGEETREPRVLPSRWTVLSKEISSFQAGQSAGLCNELPWQRHARWCYPWLLPLVLTQFVLLMAPMYVMYHTLAEGGGEDAAPGSYGAAAAPTPAPTPASAMPAASAAATTAAVTGAAGAAARGLQRVVEQVPLTWFLWVLFTGLLVSSATFAYHWQRLGQADTPPEPSLREPLTHVVVVCSFREKLEVLERTFESVARQQGLQRPPIAVLAAEARDMSWRPKFQALEKGFGSLLASVLSTEHHLKEGEAPGKSSNENHAVREIHRQLVQEQGLDPFEVVITVVDADAVLSPTYLAHLEASFRAQPDGRRLIYSGAQGNFTNFARAGVLVQCLELSRCYQDTFFSIVGTPTPYANYSLTFGFASELGFWTPDNSLEDTHTVVKAMVNSFGSRSIIAVPAVICNNALESVADRYHQARRQQWGAAAELAWVLALLPNTGMHFTAWWAVFSAEVMRNGSLPSAVSTASGLIWEVVAFVVWVAAFSKASDHVQSLLSFSVVLLLLSWAWFWTAQWFIWRRLLLPLPVERPSVARWALLVILAPVASIINRTAFLVVPTLEALARASCRGEPGYEPRPPKGGDLE